MAKTDQYREREQKCRRIADAALSPRDQEGWLRLADQWLSMAQETQRWSEKKNPDLEAGADRETLFGG